MTRRLVITLATLVILLAPAARADSGWFILDTEVNDGNVITVLPPGTFTDTTATKQNGLRYRIAIEISSPGAANILTSGAVRYGSGDTDTFDAGQLTLKVNGDGSCTLQRTSGSNNYKITLRGIWVG